MRVVGLPKPLYRAAARRAVELSPCAEERLRNLQRWWNLRGSGFSAAKAAALLELSRATLYRLEQRYRAEGVRGLEPRSRRPRRPRKPAWSPGLVEAVLRLREMPPWEGKDKIAAHLQRAGWQASTSTVGRILASLKRRGVLREPPRPGVARAKRARPRPYAIRKPKAYQPTNPGDLVQVDTLDVRPLPGVVFKHFTARDVVSRWDVLQVGAQATAASAARFLDAIQQRLPFPVRAIQVDGGSEFQGEFEQACRERGVRLFVLPPHSPKLNGWVERAHRTHQEEFYAFYEGAWTVKELTPALLRRERHYNTQRLHQSLGWRTPAEYLLQRRQGTPQTQPSHM